jgi:adenylate cyclase class 2
LNFIVSFQKEIKLTGPIETEVKIPLPQGAAEALRRIEEGGYQILSPRMLESNQVFDRTGQELRRSGQLLRLRSAGGQWTLTYKGPILAASPYKSREEIEASFPSSEKSGGESLAQILEKLGYTPAWRYEKYRTSFRAMGEIGTLFLDETPIGVFLELEGPEDWIDPTAHRLGFTKKDYVTLSYSSLYREHLRSHQGPPDMVFTRPK